MKATRKTIVTAVLTAAMAASALPLSANASIVYNREHVDGLTKIEKDYEFLWEVGREGLDHHRFTEHFTNEQGTEIISLNKLTHYLHFNLNDGVTITDVQKAISNLKSEDGYIYYASENPDSLYYGDNPKRFQYTIDMGGRYECRCDYKGLSQADVKEISKVLTENNLVSDMGYYNDKYEESCTYTPYFLTYSKGMKSWKSKEPKYMDEVINEVIEKNNLPVYVSTDDPYGNDYSKGYRDGLLFIYPKEEMTLEEKFDIAELIYQESMVSPYTLGGNSKRTISENDPYWTLLDVVTDKSDSDEPLDLMEYKEGDANLDGSENMADAVFVMQSLANPNKYEITELGSFNADIDSNGLTNADALAIQKAILKLS